MSAKDDGGPAFPGSIAVGPSGDTYHSHQEYGGGMTLRDWFAGQAMVVMANRAHKIPVHPEEIEEFARGVYLVADAMIEARGK